MSPVLARMKQAVRAAIARCGGVDGAGATASRSRTTAGEWNALQHPAFPPLDCAFALDEAVLAMGDVPPILAKYAAELGHVLVRLPDAGDASDEMTMMMVLLAKELGDVATAISEAMRDGVRSPKELHTIIAQLDEMLGAGAKMRAIAVREMESPVSSAREAA